MLVQICDFGLSRVNDPDEDSDLTQEVVTQYYRAPEVLMGSRHYTSAVDVWSAGCVLVELVSRNILFQAPNALTQVISIF